MNALFSRWRSIWRFHRVLAGILVFEYALTFAIVMSALGVLIARAEAINESSGVVEEGLYVLRGKGVDQPVHRFELFDAETRFAVLVGKDHVSMGSSVPFLGGGALEVPISVPSDSSRTNLLYADAYEGGQYFASVLGLKLLRGRMFRSDEIVSRYGDGSHVVVLSASLASRLFHEQEAIGKQVKIAGEMHTVVGVMEALAAPQYSGVQRTGYTLLLPRIPGSNGILTIRYDGSATDMDRVFDALRKRDAGKVIWSLVPYPVIRATYFASDHLTVSALAVVVYAVFVTSLCGILGLTSYWISIRRGQISIRRMLGAKRSDIFLHFLAEGGLLVVLGLILGFIFNIFLSRHLGVVHSEGGLIAWLSSITLVMFVAVVVICASLRRWLRMDPAELMRAM